MQKRTVPLVVSRAKAAGAVGASWLANMDSLILELETKWNITVGKPLYGGSHAYVACAAGQDGEQYVIKIDMPENSAHGEFLQMVSTAFVLSSNGTGEDGKSNVEHC